VAADYRWTDALVDQSWLPVLTPAALRLLWAMGRWTDRRSMRTRASPERLRAAAGLAPRTYRLALAEVVRFRLVTLGKLNGRRHMYLTLPVPPVPDEVAKTCRPRGKNLPPARQVFATPPAGSAHRRPLSADGPQKTVKKTDKKTRALGTAQGVQGSWCEANLRRPPLAESDVLDFDSVVAEGVGPWASEALVSGARVS
jgi:hypothetical protein